MTDWDRRFPLDAPPPGSVGQLPVIPVEELGLHHLWDLTYQTGARIELETMGGRETRSFVRVIPRAGSAYGNSVLQFELGKRAHMDMLITWSKAVRADPQTPPPGA